MAWFRAGGGGIPSSLKLDMNDVFNKKFGTVLQDYPPEDWPETVNLMGPLPERTVSGAVVAFADGADTVPIKSASFGIVASGGGGTPSIPVPIVGKSSVTVYQTGKNFIDFASNVNTETSVGMTFSATADGGISYSGTATGTFGYITAEFDFAIKSGQTFTFSRNTAFNYIHRIRLVFSDDTTANVSISANNTSVTYTPAKDIKAVRLLLAGLTVDTYYNDTVYVQTEYGSTPTTFQKYKSKTPITVSLGQTVYGGTLAEDGTLTLTHKVYETSQDDSNWRTGYYAFGYRYYQTAPQGAKVGGCKSDISVIGSGDLIFTVDSDNRLNAYCTSESGYDTLEKFKQALGTGIKILYELATPIVITGLDEISISTYLGDNTFWSDGNLSVTYRRDIALALAQ